MRFEPERGASALENRALRAAAERAVAPEVARRLGELAAEGDEAFALRRTAWCCGAARPAGEIGGGGPFSPRVRLFGELGADAGARARRRGGWRLSSRRRPAGGSSALRALKAAVAEGRLKGLARGLAYQLVEADGVLDRRAPIDADPRAEPRASGGC